MRLISTFPIDLTKKVTASLSANYCCYFTTEKEQCFQEEGIAYESVYLYENHQKNMENINDKIPIDDDLVKSMQEFEETAMDIIFRWRRSYTTRNDYKQIKKIYFELLRFWNDFIITREINLLVTWVPHVPIQYIIYALCKAKKIPIIYLSYLPVMEGGLQNIVLGTDFNKLDKHFEKRLEEWNRDQNEGEIALNPELAKYLDEYDKPNEEINRVIICQRRASFFKTVSLYSGRAKIYLLQKRYKILLRKALYLMTVNRSTKRILKYCQKVEKLPDLQQKFIFFPLHFQPEATTLPLGGIFVNQMLIIQMISKLLPDDIKLYIKEHPAYWKQNERYESLNEVRNKEFYDEIATLRNVELIDHDYNSLDLMDRATAIVTVTGTAAWEAAFKRKPVMLFGNILYQYLPSVFRINTIQDCKEFFEYGINQIKPQKEDLIAFLKAIEINTTQISFNSEDFEQLNCIKLSDEENDNRQATLITDFYHRNYE